MTIWKFPLNLSDSSVIEMPKGAEVLSVQIQRGIPQLWAIVDPDAPKELRVFAMYGTGHTMKDTPHTFIDTIQMSNGSLVFHIFEMKDVKAMKQTPYLN